MQAQRPPILHGVKKRGTGPISAQAQFTRPKESTALRRNVTHRYASMRKIQGICFCFTCHPERSGSLPHRRHAVEDPDALHITSAARPFLHKIQPSRCSPPFNPQRCHSERSEESPYFVFACIPCCHSAAQRRLLLPGAHPRRAAHGRHSGQPESPYWPLPLLVILVSLNISSGL